ncbi:MAG: hypothetical protein EOP14_00760 [Pseudomonas sp.]|nr:MAG: hypothetical protein EOP14_00760 [Pseudomonas sp.]
MTRSRMTMLQEALLWKTALGYLGPSNLYQTVVDLWRQAGVPARQTVEYLTYDTVGDEVVIILRNAQAQVGAMMPGQEIAPDTCALYSRHADELAGGLLERLPVRELPVCLRGFRLESDLGM